MNFIDLSIQQNRIKAEIDKNIQSVLAHGNYIMGPEVIEIEKKLAAFCGAKYCISCANGTDALQLAMMAMGVGPGDAVFVPAFTFAATAEVIPMLGATPIFVDVNIDTFNLDTESLKRSILYSRSLNLVPKVVVPVDLYGLPAEYDKIIEIAHNENMHVLADSAQSFGGIFKGQKTGALADIATTSFFPAKPLGCYGDGGAIFTNNETWALLLDSYRVHGKGLEKYDNVRIGVNSRLDTIQAAILHAKFDIYEDEIELRNKVAENYSKLIKDNVITPTIPEGLSSVWAQYTVRASSINERKSIVSLLKENNIPTMVYYPIPLTKQTAYKDFPTDPDGCNNSEILSSTVFSLPMYPYLSLSDIEKVASVINNYN